MTTKTINYILRKAILAVVAMISFIGTTKAQDIIMPSNGDTIITISPSSTPMIYDPGGPDNNYTNGTSTMTIRSTNGRPFVISGWYNIGSAHCLTLYHGASTRYPIEGTYTGTGNIKIYCYSGAVTFHFFRTPNGKQEGFELSVCFPSIYDVHVDSTNSTYTHLAWNTGDYNYYDWYLNYFQTHDPTRSTQEQNIYYTPYYNPQALAPGTEYTYHIRPFSWYGYYDTSDYCNSPPHKFRTPKVANCNTCGHNRDCIKYNDFYAEQVICYKGNTYQPDSAECVSPTQHNVITDTASFDPRTGNLLRMVPQGDTASVRLGNPENGHEGESILYEIHVDTNDYDLMVLRYTTVVRWLNTKLKHEKPRFTIRLFDENCLPIQPLCYCRDILDDDNTTGWDTSTYTSGGNTDTYLWRNWTSMGIDIAPYHGKTIYLQLSTRDGTSTGSAHAYFTLHCARKQIDHLGQCSDNIANTFYAPEGFHYRWYNAEHPNITLSSSNALAVTDSGLYQCWVSPVECFDQSCGYSISALAVPRYPHADFDSIITTSSCSFNVRFINRSYIADTNGTPLWTNEDCETAFWDFGNGQTSTNYNAEAIYTAAGTYNVRLIVGIAGGQCQDTITKQIRLVWAHQTPRLEGMTVLCPSSGEPNELHLTMYNTTSCRWEYTYDGESYSDNATELLLEDVTAQTIHCYISDSNECNYHYTIPITILPHYNSLIVQSICQAQLTNGWHWRGHIFYDDTQSDDYYFPDTTIHGCDSNVTLRLRVNETYHRYPVYTFCDYDTLYPYPPNISNPLIVYDTVGEHTYTFHTAQGCDSIIHITMRTHAVEHDTIVDRICRGFAYDTLDFHYSATDNNSLGTRIVTHSGTEQMEDATQVRTCDSTMTLILTVNPQSESQRNYQINQNLLPFTFNGVTFDHPVTDTIFHLTNRYGCDSTLRFTLRVNYNTSTQYFDTICASQLPYTWDGIVFDRDSTVIERLTRINGADSLIIHRLIVNPTYANSHYDTICDNSSITFCGITYSTANTYTHSMTSQHGCDSTETLTLTVYPTKTTSLVETICNNHPYILGNDTIDSTGVYNHHFATTHSCDSSVTLNLTVLPTGESFVYDTIIENGLPYTFMDSLFNDSITNYHFSISNSHGCDSIIHFSLYVHWNHTIVVERNICLDQLSPAYNWDGTLFTENELTGLSGTIIKSVTLTDRHGADSTVERHLHVKPIYDEDLYDTICNNTSYSFVDSVYTISGIYAHHLITAEGCDSMMTLHLTVNAVTYSTVDTTIIQNALPSFIFNGHSFSGEVSHETITITNNAGCDSIIDFTLHIISNVTDYVSDTVCQSMLPIIWNGVTFNTAGTQNALLYTTGGADSMVVMTLVVNPIYNDTIRRTICDNQSTTFNGIDYNTSCIHTDSLLTVAGCDSVLTLRLTVNAVTYRDLYDTIVENQMPYSLNGVTYTLAQTELMTPLVSYLRDTVTITNVMNCDSVIDLQLYVHLNVYDTVDSTICDNYLPLQWNHRTFTSDTAYTLTHLHLYTLNDTLTAWTGADSILTMRLHVNPTYDLHYYDTICSNEQLIFNDSTYSLPSNYPHLLHSIDRCDSLETLHLTVYGTSAAYISDTVVENQLLDIYTFNGVVFDTALCGAGMPHPLFTQTDTLIVITNAIGCDSAINYTLNVHWNKFATADSTICENYLPLQWNHRTFTGDTPYTLTPIHLYTLTDTLTASTGADSILTMTLHVDTNTHSIIHDTILENDLPYSFNGATYTFTPSHLYTSTDTITISNAKGCDSVIYHTLFIRWNKTTDIADTICENFFPYTWQGRTINADTSYTNTPLNPYTLIDTATYTAVGGEDSLVVMHLHVKRNSTSTLYDTIVENSLNHLWNGVTFTWDDTVAVGIRHADLQQTGIIPNAAGCDSIAAMNLMVWLNRTASADSSVCENFFDFTWNGILFDTTDSKNVMLSTTHGADSLLTMNVTELFNSSSAAIDTIVENQLAYTFNGAIIDHYQLGFNPSLRLPPSSMTYIDTTVIIANAAGCDSIISYRLNVWWNVVSSTDDTLCSQMLPHQWNGRIFTQAVADTSPTEGRWRMATLYDTLPAWSGADSLLAMNLHVMPSFYINFNDTVCASRYIAWYGDTLYDTGVYPMAFNTIDGCDSIEYLHFANYPNYDFEYFDTICDYSGTMRLGVEYMGVAHLPTMNGCDSNEIYHLWGMPVNYSNVDTIVSEHQIPFAYYGEWFADSGTSQQQFILTNRYGCDSIVNFTITVMPTVRQTLDSSICEGELPLTWGNSTFTSDSSTYTLHPTLYTLIDTLPGAYGADSIVTRRLHVFPQYDLTYVDTTCNGAPYHFGDSTYIVTGTYTHNYLTTITDPVYGVRCDSIETLHLQVNAMSYSTLRDTIVENQLPWTFGGVTFTTTDHIVDSIITILNTVACDSVITYSLLVFPNSYVNRDTVVCDNELPFLWDGRLVTQGGLDSVITLMPNGTDSVTRYWTVVNTTYNSTDTVRICDSYTWIDGNTYTESIVVNGLTLTSIEGCDSVKNLKLTIDHQITTHDSIASCDPYTWIDSITYEASVSGPTHLLQTIHGCDSTVVLEFTKLSHKETELFDTICRGVHYPFGGNEYGETGLYTDSLKTATLCDSVVLLNLHVLEPPTITFDIEYNCDTRIYILTGHCDVPYYEWSSFPDDPALTGHTHDRTIQVRPTTHERYTFFADYKDVPTCPSTKDTNLSPLLRPHALIEYTPEFLTYDQLHASAISRCTNEETRRWYVNDNDMGDHERISYLADPRTDDSVVIVLTASHGICHDTDMVVIPFRKATIWVPNAFTPGESSNNLFFVRYVGITDYHIDLYTRGGALVWHSDDMNDTWDGTYQGKPCPQDSYVWIIHYRDITAPNNLLSKKGTVTLIR